jgi:hypothetical protein
VRWGDLLDMKSAIAGSGSKVTSIRFYRIALVASLIANVLLGAAFYLYVHFVDTTSSIEDVIGAFE